VFDRWTVKAFKINLWRGPLDGCLEPPLGPLRDGFLVVGSENTCSNLEALVGRRKIPIIPPGQSIAYPD
jgi:hypothetical protein